MLLSRELLKTNNYCLVIYICKVDIANNLSSWDLPNSYYLDQFILSIVYSINKVKLYYNEL